MLFHSRPLSSKIRIFWAWNLLFHIEDKFSATQQISVVKDLVVHGCQRFLHEGLLLESC